MPNTDTRPVWVEHWRAHEVPIRVCSRPYLEIYRRYLTGELTREELGRAAFRLTLS